MGGSSVGKVGVGTTTAVGAAVVGSTTASTRTASTTEGMVDAPTPKSSKKKERGETLADVGEAKSRASTTTATAAKSSKTIKAAGTVSGDTLPSKIKRKDDDALANNAPKQKSAKKVKRGDGTTTDGGSSSSSKNESRYDDAFVSSKKFSGAKRGYVFRKGDSGLGYYRDTPPVADRVGLAGLLAKAVVGGRKSMGGQHANRKKKGGNSRRSY
jgi:hypothetical protein